MQSVSFTAGAFLRRNGDLASLLLKFIHVIAKKTLENKNDPTYNVSLPQDKSGLALKCELFRQEIACKMIWQNVRGCSGPLVSWRAVLGGKTEREKIRVHGVWYGKTCEPLFTPRTKPLSPSFGSHFLC